MDTITFHWKHIADRRLPGDRRPLETFTFLTCKDAGLKHAVECLLGKLVVDGECVRIASGSIASTRPDGIETTHELWETSPDGRRIIPVKWPLTRGSQKR